MNSIEPSVMATQHLTFFVNNDEYAIPVLRIREVIEALPITRVPSTPSAVRGVVNLRGSVVPVIDLGLRFGLAERSITKWTCIVIVLVDIEGEQSAMGLLVDSVNDVIELDPSAIEAVPSFGARLRVEFLKGMGLVNSKLVLILDVDRVLSIPDLIATAALPEQASAGDDARQKSAKAVDQGVREAS